MAKENLKDWHKLATSIKLDGRAFINGKRVHSCSGEIFTSISPINGEIIAEVAKGQLADIDLAVSSARAAFNDQRWAGKSPRERKDILLNLAKLVIENGDELAITEALDMGKPANYARNVDVNSAAHCLRWYAEAIDKVYDEIAPTAKHTLALVRREPVGVVAAIVPWNYPLLMACWKIATALAAGNSVILKPSEKSPLSALRLGELALEAGIPPGVLNVVPGFGADAGTPLALHNDVDCIAFTGSTKVGKQIIQYAGQSNLKRAWTELGGKSPFIVFANSNLETAVNTCISSIFFNQGESCNAPSRLLLDESIARQAIEIALNQIDKYQPKHPLNNDTVMGALVDEIQMNTVLKYIDSGKEQGANLLAGGRRIEVVKGGYYVQPTIFADVQPTMKICREEIFGPVLSILTFKNEQEALQLANDTPYGLAASVWSNDLAQAHNVAQALRAGTVHVNCYDEDDITVPFGGYKESGNGRDKSLHAFDKYSELKTTWIKLK